jgi:hypothetical protein
MPAKKASSIPQEILDRYSDLVATLPDIGLNGATMPYTSINGNMFSFLSADGRLHFPLSKADKAAFMEKYSAAETMQHGVTMKEYVEVPDTVWNDVPVLTRYFQTSFDYASGLKPKATTKSKKQ